jgi:hypothetical protein
MIKKLIFCLAFAALVSTAWAWDGTFVNANTDNTVSDYNSPWWKTSGNDSIPLWRLRGSFGLPEGGSLPLHGTDLISGQSSGQIYQARDSWGDSAGLDWCTLKTTTTLPNDDKTYYVYAFFWNDEHQSPWRIRAAFSEAGLANGLYIGGSPPSGPITPIQVGIDNATNGGRIMWAAEIGTVVATGQDLTVWIDDEPNDNSNARSWYDGIGYGVQVPEPMTIALLGLGGLLLRRRKR